MRVLVLGGDGFCGWPTTLRLSAAGHDVAVVDDFARRGADAELSAGSLTPIRSLNERVAAWRERGGAPVAIHTLDVATDHDALRDLLATWRPAAVVHLARQRSAAYSMRTATHRRYTVDNNVSATHNLLAALVETGVDAHVVWRADADEGGSVAHLTQVLDRALLAFYAEHEGVRATALRQGVVWGTQTAETRADERLLNRFDSDDDYGTVLNRLLVRVAIGDRPAVEGPGERAHDLLHLVDAVAGIERALLDPPGRGAPVRTLTQVTETRTVADLVRRVAALPDATAASESHGVPAGAAVRDGDAPTVIADGPLLEVVDLARRYRDRIDARRIAGTQPPADDDAPDVLVTA